MAKTRLHAGNVNFCQKCMIMSPFNCANFLTPKWLTIKITSAKNIKLIPQQYTKSFTYYAYKKSALVNAD